MAGNNKPLDTATLDNPDDGQGDIVVPEVGPVNEPIIDIDAELGSKRLMTDDEYRLHEEEQLYKMKVTAQVTSEDDWTRELTDKEKERVDNGELDVMFDLPSANYDDREDRFRKADNIDIVTAAKEQEWASTVMESSKFYVQRNVNVASFSKEGSDWRQGVSYNGMMLRGGIPNVRGITNSNMTGERATLHLTRYMGTGSLFRQPLWNTGIWVTFKAPTEPEIVALHQQLLQDKADFGRATYGLAYSNAIVYSMKTLLDYAIGKIFNTTLKDVDYNALGDIIMPQDYPMILAGLAGAMYANGYIYKRSCVDNPTKCDFVAQEIMNIAKMIYTDNAGLTDWQKSHMASMEPGSRTMENVKMYQDEMLRSQGKVVTVESSTGAILEVSLKTPNINQWVSAGSKWVQEITGIVEKSITKAVNDKDRKAYVVRLAQASYLRQYAHWIKELKFSSNTIDDTASIDQQLTWLSADDTTREQLIDKVTEYISESAISIFGVPAFNCPVCGKDQTTIESKRHPTVIPLDVQQLFFEIVTKKIQRIKQR